LSGQIVAYGLTLAGKLYHCLKVIELLGYLTIEFEALLKTGALLKDLAGAFLIGVEVGFGKLFLKLIELTLLRAGVKETSALPRFGFSLR
jgi:hypothetical protein